MLRKLKVQKVTWISLVDPEHEDIEELHNQFPEIHPLILEDLRTPTIRPLVENYDHHLYMVIHFPALPVNPVRSLIRERISKRLWRLTSNGVKEHKTISHEVDFILMKDTVITVQYKEVPLLEEFLHECEDAEGAGRQYGKSPVHLLYYILHKLFSNALRELDQIQIAIDDVEEEIFAGREKEILEDISLLKRHVLDFSRAVRPQHLTLQSLENQGIMLYGEQTRPFLAGLVGEYLKVWNLLENHKETLDALYDTNNSRLVLKTNEIMRVFTIIAFVSFIPTAIANIYGMNIANIPLANSPNAFFVVAALMLIITTLVYIILKWRKLV